jgi:hypothetical protein
MLSSIQLLILCLYSTYFLSKELTHVIIYTVAHTVSVQYLFLSTELTHIIIYTVAHTVSVQYLFLVYRAHTYYHLYSCSYCVCTVPVLVYRAHTCYHLYSCSYCVCTVPVLVYRAHTCYHLYSCCQPGEVLQASHLTTTFSLISTILLRDILFIQVQRYWYWRSIFQMELLRKKF